MQENPRDYLCNQYHSTNKLGKCKIPLTTLIIVEKVTSRICSSYYSVQGNI